MSGKKLKMEAKAVCLAHCFKPIKAHKVTTAPKFTTTSNPSRKYHSEPNEAAIRLGRDDLRVDHGHFGNHMAIRNAQRADDTEVVPPKNSKQLHRPQPRSIPSPLIDDEQ